MLLLANTHRAHRLLAMNSATALRRLAAGGRTAVSLRPTLNRTYATQERDPQVGDYPQVPNVSRAFQPPTGWWDNQMRRNFGDIVRSLSIVICLY